MSPLEYDLAFDLVLAGDRVGLRATSEASDWLPHCDGSYLTDPGSNVGVTPKAGCSNSNNALRDRRQDYRVDPQTTQRTHCKSGLSQDFTSRSCGPRL